MADYTAIAEVGETLIDLLRDNLDSGIRDSIVIISPGEIETGDNIRLSLFLYQIIENTHLKNQEMQTTDPFDPTRLKYPPLNLDLYYMLTSHPSNEIKDKTERTKEEHSLLGRSIQILNDNSILKGSALRGSLAEHDDELHLTMVPISHGDITNIWNTFLDKPFRPSVCYQVTPVTVESTRKIESERVTERKLEKSFIG